MSSEHIEWNGISTNIKSLYFIRIATPEGVEARVNKSVFECKSGILNIRFSINGFVIVVVLVQSVKDISGKVDGRIIFPFDFNRSI